MTRWGMSKRQTWFTAFWFVPWIAFSLTGATATVATSSTTEREVSYLVDGTRNFDQSYDLYRPSDPAGLAKNANQGALVIFVHSRFWRERQPDPLIAKSFVPGLLRAGHAVAVLRHRLMPEAQFPDAIEDVARGVASLLSRVEAGEFDSDRVFIAGHSSGAQLALTLALDPQWLVAQKKSVAALAGVLSISGIVDLSPNPSLSAEEESIYSAAFPISEQRLRASPSSHSNPTLASILFLVAASDVPGYRGAAMKLADGLREAGHESVEVFVANGRNHFSILDLADSRNDARRHVFEYLASNPRARRLPDAWRVLSTWRSPPFTTEDFHTRFPDLVDTFEADRQFSVALNRPFQQDPSARQRLSVRRYQAIDLVKLLSRLNGASAGSTKSGMWLELRNIRGEWSVLNMAEVRKLAPRLVIGLDGERNLFRATDLYHTLRRYSWVDTEPNRIDMARPLGAFLYFPDAEPESADDNRYIGRYALTSDSFRLRDDDPRAVIADLPPLVRAPLLSTPGCLGCHQFRGVGGQAFHVRADDASKMGGIALPLERYPRIVWKRFVFDQAAVAREVGASAIEFEPATARALHDFVATEKERSGVEVWIHPDRDRTAD